jgi:hypothetical protein
MIREYTELDKDALEEFKSIAWPAADLEHWGENPPDFSKHQKVLVTEHEGQVVGYGTISTDAGVRRIRILLTRSYSRKDSHH